MFYCKINIINIYNNKERKTLLAFKGIRKALNTKTHQWRCGFVLGIHLRV
jgi:hypothetical protein